LIELAEGAGAIRLEVQDRNVVVRLDCVRDRVINRRDRLPPGRAGRGVLAERPDERITRRERREGRPDTNAKVGIVEQIRLERLAGPIKRSSIRLIICRGIRR
jgi:hypothetical protein